MRRHLPLIALVLLFVGLAALYNALTPVGEGPDEPGHGQYVLLLAREGRLPVQCAAPCVSDVPGSGHHPPLAYLLAAPLVSWLPREQRQIELPGNRRFSWSGGEQVNAVAHGTRERWPWAPAVLAWHMARLASTAAGAAALVFTFLAARAVADQGPRAEGQAAARQGWRPAAPLLAAGLLALNPQFIFTSALISNDALLAALSAALLWLVVGRGPDQGGIDPVQHPQRRWPPALGGWPLRRALAVGLVLGLALLTKASALLLAPLALAWAVADHSPAAERVPQRSDIWRWSAGGGQWPARLLRCGAVLGVAAAVAGWWYARNLRLYGDALGLDLFRAEFVTQPFDPRQPAAWGQALAQLYASGWARFGWLNVLPPVWVDGLYAALGLAGVAGLALGLARGHEPSTDNQQPDAERQTPRARRQPARWLARAWPLLALPALAGAWVLSFALTAGLVAWQGRLLFPAAAALAALLAIGVCRSHDAAVSMPGVPRMAVRAGSWLLAAGSLALALWLPLGVIRPAYPNPALTEGEALAGLGAPVYGRFARTDEAGAELRGWAVGGAARPGQALELDLTWHALGRQNRDWWLFAHLVDAQGAIVAEANAEVGGGVFPMLQWVAGDWMRDRQRLMIPAGVAPGAYELRVGLWYPDTGRRARVYADGGTLLGDHLTLTTVTVQP